jgi:predicted negative regulator of RcsB-dependent stress response
MNINEMRREIGGSIADLRENASRVPYLKHIILGICCVLLILGSFGLYKWNSSRVLRNAQVDLGSCLFEYSTQEESENPDWVSVVQTAKNGYEKNSGTILAPYFLLTQSNALLKQGNYQEGHECMAHAVETARGTVLLPLIELRYALMLLDMDEPERKEEGKQKLIKLARDDSNAYQDAAQYHLGRYYFVNDDFVHAREVWTLLTEKASMESVAPSSWGLLAGQKLSQLA